MRTRLFIGIPFVVAAVVLAACGGGGAQPTPTSVPPTPTSVPPTPTPAVSGGVGEEAGVTGDATRGKELFVGTCAACHGPTAEGIPGLGKDLTTSEFVAGLSDAELLEFIKKGRPIDDPLNTTGVEMPPRGGNMTLTDDDLRDIIAYIRSLHKD